MFFMPEYYPLQILLGGVFPENLLSAALGCSVGAAAEESRGHNPPSPTSLIPVRPQR
jgi:hypothetical protein